MYKALCWSIEKVLGVSKKIKIENYCRNLTHNMPFQYTYGVSMYNTQCTERRMHANTDAPHTSTNAERERARKREGGSERVRERARERERDRES
jgi:hypothetical protein